MIKCEMHLHTKGGSYCGQSLPQEIAREYFDAGYKAIVVTNHYMKSLFDSYYTQRTEKQKIKYYISLYKEVKKYCGQYGINVFLGLELNPDCMNTPTVSPAAEFLCYGVTEDFLFSNLRLYNLSQQQLYELFEKNNIIMMQSHPFRNYCVLGNPEYMHGVEVYNGHPTQQNNNNKSEQFAEKHRLKGISGSDYHARGGIGGGIYLPQNINMDYELVNYIKSNKLKLIKGNS